MKTRTLLLVWSVVSLAIPALGEDGYRFWLRYDPVPDQALREQYRRQCRELVVLGRSEVLDAARDELLRGLKGMLGQAPPSVPKASGSLLPRGYLRGRPHRQSLCTPALTP